MENVNANMITFGILVNGLVTPIYLLVLLDQHGIRRS